MIKIKIKLKHDKDIFEEVIENVDSQYFDSGNFVVYYNNRKMVNMYKTSTVLKVEVIK